ncbi:MAG: FtsX-like permease family protein [Planctomycetota bacterium]|nr:MAG: FtsX-like permease family protein [Planctomycetota bacterium]
MSTRTPLAWKNLTSSWRKCLLAASGVGFAVVLMFMQIGFRGALIDNNVQILAPLDTSYANLAVISRSRYNLTTEQRFSRRLLEAVAGRCAGGRMMPLQLERGTARIHVAGRRPRPIRVMAVETDVPQMFRDPELRQRLARARQLGGALVDRRSKSMYGFASDVEELRTQYAELNGQQVPLIDFFSMGTDFSSDGTLLMTTDVYAQYFPWRNPGGEPNEVIDIGLIHLDAVDTDALQLAAAELQDLAPAQIQVMPTRDLIAREKAFWLRSTPIGKIFTVGVLLGLVVGAIICYQIQFTDITDHLPEFATLKAMGYPPAYFVRFVVAQSFYLACLGFVPGALISWGLYALLTETSGLIMAMTLVRATIVFTLTLGMCVVSGVFAMRKLFTTDPASLF